MTVKKVYILPCSGIGKVFGSIGREAAYIVVNELAKDKAALECLPLVVKGKKEVIQALKSNKVIVIDGCPMRCSYNDVTEAIGKVDAQFLSTDIVKEHRDLKPEQDIIPLGDNTKKLSQKLAEKIVQKVDELLEEDQGDE
ncbi:MAG TPA: putative zinc-binding protein [Candidatus Deferrimicrobium sp.]|nr:putative zinc-binding protein [Candidatus Deferrimicrobium sp.]